MYLRRHERSSPRATLCLARRSGHLVAATAGASLAVLAGSFGLGGHADSATKPKGNVQVVKESFFISNNTVRIGIAKCPNGTRVMSGGFGSNGQHARIFVAGPSRDPHNGFVVHAYTPPVNINTGVGKETARILVVAYCAPTGQPVVFG